MVVFVTNPMEFWCHMKRYDATVEKLSEQLALTYQALGPSDQLLRNLRPGSTCAAYSEADAAWYRATVESVSNHMSLSTGITHFNLRRCLID
jgi:hypothetical protein